MQNDRFRVIKISREALFEFIYEKFIDELEHLFDVDALEVTSYFDIDWDRGEFVCCVHKDEDGVMMQLPDGIDLKRFMRNIPDTTASMYEDNIYRDYTKEEMVELSKFH